LAYHDVRVLEQQSKGNFSLSTQALVGYKQYRIGIEYWHQSNAGLGTHNAGIDVLALTTGWRF
jgi:hypothetical protein